MMTSST